MYFFKNLQAITIYIEYVKKKEKKALTKLHAHALYISIGKLIEKNHTSCEYSQILLYFCLYLLMKQCCM